MFYKEQPFQITLDSGATVSFIRQDVVMAYKIPVLPNDQLALLADDKTRMSSLGEIDIELSRGQIRARLRALVMKSLQAPCFGGTTFHYDNDIQPQIRQKQIKLHNKHVLYQTDERLPIPMPTLNATKASHALLTISKPTTVGPDGFLQIPLGKNKAISSLMAIHPVSDDNSWYPMVCPVVDDHIQYTNTSEHLLHADKSVKFLCMAAGMPQDTPNVPSKSLRPVLASSTLEDPIKMICDNSNLSFLNDSDIKNLKLVLQNNIAAFDNDLSQGYNAKSGRYFAKLNFKPDVLPESKICPIPLYNSKCANLQQALMDELERQHVLVDPQQYNINVKKISPSFILQKGRAKHKKLDDCSTSDIRWVVGFNNLNDSLLPKPSKPTSARNILTFLAKFRYHIFADLHNSYFQIPVAKKDWEWLGVRTPFKGVRVLTRAGQGLLNSEHELDELISRVLGQQLQEGICYAERDDIVIGGQTPQEALSNFDNILTRLNANNMKLSPKKVRIFPSDFEVFGWRIQDGKVKPSEHIINTLGKTSINQLSTNKQVNSWKGLYKTLLNSLPHLASIMDPFDRATAGTVSKDRFTWTPSLIAAFNTAQSHLAKVNSLTLPLPSEQLILMPDGARVPGGVGWALFVQRPIEGTPRLFPVQFFSAKIKPYMQKWLPCEIEGVASAMAIDSCAHWILASNKPTYVTPDCKAVVQAVERMRQGKLSRNPRLQMILICINRRPVTFIHSSAKMGQHVIPDSASRLDITCHSQDCAVERFLNEYPQEAQCMSIDTTVTEVMTTNTDPCIIAATSTELITNLLSPQGLPIGNKDLWKSIQQQDPDLSTVLNLIRTGDSPRKSASRTINAAFKLATVRDGLLVIQDTDSELFKDSFRIVAPRSYVPSILSMIHLKGNHPSKYQSEKVFQKYFFCPGFKEQLDLFYNNCYLCNATKRVHNPNRDFRPSEPPQQPGTHMNVDIIRRAKQHILVNVDLFSKFVTTTIVRDETTRSITEGIIQVVAPLRRSTETIVRTDAAPAFQSLQKKPSSDLNDLGIVIILGESLNKNSNCHVDRIIQELENEIRKIDPTNRPISGATLAKATLQVNAIIRSQGLSAKEITFRRDDNTNNPLKIPDKNLAEAMHSNRLRNPKRIVQLDTPQASPGDMVLLKTNPSKHAIRQPFVVTSKTDENLTIQKVIARNPANLRIASRQHTVQESRVFHLGKFPAEAPPDKKTCHKSWNPFGNTDSDDEEDIPRDQLPRPPDIHVQNLAPVEPPPDDINITLDQEGPEDQPELPQAQENNQEGPEDQPELPQAQENNDRQTRQMVYLAPPDRAQQAFKLHSTELPPRDAKKAAKTKIDEMYKITQIDGAISTDTSFSTDTSLIERTPQKKTQGIYHRWGSSSLIYGLDEPHWMVCMQLPATSCPTLLVDTPQINAYDNLLWTCRKRSYSASDILNVDLPRGRSTSTKSQ